MSLESTPGVLPLAAVCCLREIKAAQCDNLRTADRRRSKLGLVCLERSSRGGRFALGPFCSSAMASAGVKAPLPTIKQLPMGPARHGGQPAGPRLHGVSF